MHQHKFFISFILLIICFAAKSQNKTLITEKFVNESFGQFTNYIENTTSYHFFYNDEDVDSIRINFEADKITVDELLNAVLKNTDLHFSIDDKNRIFINKYFTIKTDLATNFFDNDVSNKDSVKNYLPVLSNQTTNINAAVSVENKLYIIGTPTNNSSTSRVTLAGYVKDSKSGEAISNASVTIDSTGISASTDKYGYYSITLPKGYYVLSISGAGKENTKRKIQLNSNGNLNIEMTDYIATLKDVTVTSERKSNTLNTQMGVNNLSIQTIKQLPAVLGETDIIKSVLTLPGVTSVGEASNGFNVRGGATDQNLILFGDATIYNPSHLFGFFSAFNPDDVNNVELYKSSLPEKYGGRLASVLDISLKDGNDKNWTGNAGIGPLTSKFTIEGPIKKNKTSLIASARTTYSDWLLHSLKNNAYNKSNADFYDADIHLTHIANEKNTFYVNGYISNDKFSLNSDTTYTYNNKNANAKWKHIFTNKFNGALTVAYDDYQYAISDAQNPVNAFDLTFKIQQSSIRADFDYAPNYRNKIDFGVTSIYYKLNPGSYSPDGSASLVVQNILPSEQAVESAVYAGDNFSITSKLSVDGGIHYSMFNYLGPHAVNNYLPGLPKDTTTISGTQYYTAGKIIKTYSYPEVRLSTRYLLSENSSIKASFNTTAQYIHMLSNTVSVSPTDIWKLSDPNIKPTLGRQVSVGYYKNFKTSSIESSVEIYYKQIDDYLDYKSGASLLLNPHIETDVIDTKGKAYGVEFLLKKTLGKLNGWISYTYSRTLLKSSDSLTGEVINNGNYYPADFDKPNNFNFIGNYRFSHRYSISANVVYSTGRPITLPLAVFNNGGAVALYYSQRNEYRIPDYFRCDLSVNIDGNHKIKQRIHNSVTFGVYNLTGRQNAYSVYFINQNGKVQGYQLSIFGTPIPFITFNMRF